MVLVVDEAQNLSPEVLEQVRLLTNLETNTQKLLQIILIGQPELRELLARTSCASSRNASPAAIT
jgi:general secretion pathway protein A